MTILRSLISRNFKVLVALTVVIAGVVYQEKLQSLYSILSKQFVKLRTKDIPGVYSQDKLALYNGIDQGRLYLAILGTIYDVTKGKRHYERGGSYHYFVGKDGTRSFVTGDFNDESSDKDHVMDLKCSQLNDLITWRQTLQEKYKMKGVLIGRYYDEEGKKTAYHEEVEAKIANCRKEKEATRREEAMFPPCNMEWSVEEGSRVWCTRTSGGISRDWAGVPRLLYSPGLSPRCACINPNKENSQALLKEYDGCHPNSASCVIHSEL